MMLCGACALALVAPAEALSATATYSGTADADPTTTLTLKIKKKHGDRVLTLARAENLAISCSGGTIQARLGSAEIRPREKLSDGGKFKAKGSNGFQTINVAGKLKGKTITGKFRYSGFTDVEGETMGCDSGKVAFTAKK